MKKPLRHQSCNSRRTAKHPGRISRAKPRQRRLCLEALEGRALLSLIPQMVLDINAVTFSSVPSELVAIGSTTYFIADDGVHGVELWKSDGTTAGTVLVKDIFPGAASSDFGSLTKVNETLFFTT